MRPGKAQNIAKFLVIAVFFLFMGGGFLISGDLFLAFIGKKIHVRLDHKNHSGFISCFLLKFIELEEPVFVLKDFDFAVECERAFIEPGFGRLKNGTVVLNCRLENASLRDNAVLEKLLFDSVHTELIIYGETVEFPFFAAHGKDAKLYASGFVTESGDLAIKIKAFFSSEIAAGFPEDITALLVERPGGWHSYDLDLKQKEGVSSLKLESELLQLDFERIENK